MEAAEPLHIPVLHTPEDIQEGARLVMQGVADGRVTAGQATAMAGLLRVAGDMARLRIPVKETPAPVVVMGSDPFSAGGVFARETRVRELVHNPTPLLPIMEEKVSPDDPFGDP